MSGPFGKTYIYVISEGDPAGPVKIGRSTSPFMRVIELQCGNPRQLSVEKMWEIPKHRLAYAIEHAIYAALERGDPRRGGEWFQLSVKAAIYLVDEHCQRVLQPAEFA